MGRRRVPPRQPPARKTSASRPQVAAVIRATRCSPRSPWCWLLVAGCGGGYLYWANKQLGEHPAGRRWTSTPRPGEGPQRGRSKPLNILLLGADHGNVGQSVAEDLEDGEWTPASTCSDTIMVLHIPADRKSAQLVSIPRDTWVKIDGYPQTTGTRKINAAFSYGGPALAVKTVEDLTGLTIDHVAIIDWAGFRDLTTAARRRPRLHPGDLLRHSASTITWEQGWQTLEGERALQYVRTRHDIPAATGDFGRIARQQNFMRALMGKLLSSVDDAQPGAVHQGAASLSSYLTVDGTWDNDEIRARLVAARPAHRRRRTSSPHRSARTTRSTGSRSSARHAAVPGPGAHDQNDRVEALHRALPGQPAGRR